MHAQAKRLIDILSSQTQFMIPIYQRTYSWTEKECRCLWDDIIRSGEINHIQSHFIGSIVYVLDNSYSLGSIHKAVVIDGQQRITTILLMLKAISERIGDERFGEYSSELIRNVYLTNQYASLDYKAKLVLTQSDKETFEAIIGDRPYPETYSTNVHSTYGFIKLLAANISDPIIFFQGLAKLRLVDISLDYQDNPQLIFESLNSTGKPLSQADLIRNFLLMGLPIDVQDELYSGYWRKLEQLFSDDRQKDFDVFMRHFLLLKTKQPLKIDAIYSKFKNYVHQIDEGSDDGHKRIVAGIYQFATYYCNMAYGKEPIASLKNAFNDLVSLRVETSFPLLLEMYQDYQDNHISAEDFEKCIRLIESYVYRRYACNLPTNSLDKTFLTFSKSLNKKDYVNSFNKILASFDSYRRFPSDDEFLENLQIKELYSSNQIAKCKYSLSKLEEYGWKEHVNLDNLTIEHVMPQTLDTQWKDYLGENYEDIYRIWLNRLGNLTLSGYNSEYQNYSFQTKRDMEGGYKDSAVHLNQSLAKESEWTAKTMELRGRLLAQKALQVWCNHSIPFSQVEAVRSRFKKPQSYDLDSYSGFNEGSASRVLYEALYGELNYTDVSYLKYYIALKYKDTNLLTLSPTGHGLKCWLSLDFSDLKNSEGFKNVKDIGHWGTGNTEFYLSNQNQFPVLLAAVTQAKEKIDHQSSDKKKLSPYKIWQRDYWEELRNYCLEKQFFMNPSATLRPAKPYIEYFFLTEIPYTSSWVNKNNDKKTLGCGIVFYPNTHDLYEIVLRHKAEVEQILGTQAIFKSFEKSDHLYINAPAYGDLPESDKNKEFEWYVRYLSSFKIILTKLKSKEWV